MLQIAGYQVKSSDGSHVTDSDLLLTIGTAIKIRDEANHDRILKKETCFIQEVLFCDSEGMQFETPLMQSNKQFRTIGLSTAHVSDADSVILQRLGLTSEYNMIWTRDKGWIVKIQSDGIVNQDDFRSMNRHTFLSDKFLELVHAAYHAGYSMIEFSSETDICPDMKTY